MKKSLFLFALALALGFGLITILKTRPSERGDFPGVKDQKKRLITFWDAYHQATALRVRADFPQAIDHYRQALELDPNHEESLYYLGNCWFELGEYGEALRVYRRLTEVNPNSHRGFSQLGVTLSTLAPGAPWQPDRAREAFLRNAEINQEESGPFLRLGLLALKVGDLQAASRYFETAAGFRSPEGYFMAGLVLFHQERYPEAARRFLQVLEIDAKEKAITGRGVLSEGDIQPSQSGKTPTPLEAAAMKSLLYLYWTAVRLGGYPASASEQFRIRAPSSSTAPLTVTDLSAETGLPPGQAGRAAWSDYDGDGDQDLSVARTGPLALYENRHGRLVDVAAAVGLASALNAWDLCWGDFDADGNPDLYLVRPGYTGVGQNTLYRNEKTISQTSVSIHFSDVTAAAGLAGRRSTSRAFFLDYNNDGQPDLIEVGNQDPLHPALRLFVNQGGRFLEQSKKAGIEFSGNAVDCAITDYNQDGLPDLLVLRWGRPAILFRNSGQGRFVEATEEAGLKGVGKNSYSALFFDYDRDQLPDLLVAGYAPYELAVQNLLKPGSADQRFALRLFRNEGGKFREVTREARLVENYGVMQIAAVDVNSDGWPDLVLANGGLERYRLEPGVMLLNRSGQGFSDPIYIPSFDFPANSAGICGADIDGDGNPELYLSGAGLYGIRSPRR